MTHASSTHTHSARDAMGLLCIYTLLRPEAVDLVELDLGTSQLLGFSCQEVEPLLRRLELMSLVKDLQKLQQLMGGAAAADPELAAAVPAAVEKLAEFLTAQQLRGSSGGSSTAGSSGSRSGQPAAAKSDLNDAVAAAVVSSAVPAPRSSVLPASVRLLPDTLQQRIPDVHVITNQQQLQQLVQRLLDHKVSFQPCLPFCLAIVLGCLSIRLSSLIPCHVLRLLLVRRGLAVGCGPRSMTISQV